MRRTHLIRRGCVALCATVICPVAAEAADYEITASGPLNSSFTDSSTYDGSTHGTLPPALDVARLAGGSFVATFRFTAPTPVVGSANFYDLSPTSGMTFDLLDSGGLVVHHGSNFADAQAFVQNDNGSASFINDQVFLPSSVASINNITGATVPSAIYTPTGDLIAVSDFNFAGSVSPGFNYINDLSVPIDAATYLGFPFRTFNVLVDFGDGDYIDRVGPHQFVDTSAEYQITALTVTPVPEPTSLALLLAAGGGTLLGRRRLYRRDR